MVGYANFGLFDLLKSFIIEAQFLQKVFLCFGLDSTRTSHLSNNGDCLLCGDASVHEAGCCESPGST